MRYISRFFIVIGVVAASLFGAAKLKAVYYTAIVAPSGYKNIGTPRDMISLAGGFLWYVDSQNFRIVKVDSSGQVVRTVGREGSDEGEFEYLPTSITRDSDGFLYVTTLRKIYKFDFNGGYIQSWGVYGSGAGELSEPKTIHYSSYGDYLVVSNSGNNRVSIFSLDGSLVREFGSNGSGDGEFDSPHGLTTDSAGNIYVVDTNNQRVQVFSETGVFIRKFGTSGAGDYQFVYPKDVGILSNGDILVTSQNAPLVKKFDSTGSYLAEWGANGTEDNQFVSPEYVSIADDDTVWLSDWNQKRMQHFENDGTYLGKIANNGVTAGLFTNPYSVDFDSSGNIYVLDSTGRVQKFNSEGVYLATVISAGDVGIAAYHIVIQPITGNILVSSEATVRIYDSNGNFITSIGTQGLNGASSGNGDFNHARGMVFDSSGYLYVADLFNARIQKFDLSQLEDPDFGTTYNGGYVSQWTAMVYVEFLAIDSSDYIYASPPDSAEENGFVIPINKYNTSGILQQVFVSEYGADPGQYWEVGGIEIDDNNELYVADKYFNKLLRYDSSGIYQETLGSSGSDLDQYSNIRSPKVNPIDNSLVIADTNNHRIQILNDGSKIHNLIPSADVINSTNSASLVRTTVNPSVPEASNLSAKLFFGEYVVSDFTVDLSSDRDWTSVNAIILPDESKSLVVNLNPTDAPGVSATHSLYVVKQANQSSVRVCSDATTIAQVATGCSGYTLNQGDPNLTIVSLSDIDYWKVSGLTGTGAYSVADASASPTPTPTSNTSNQSQSSQGGGGSSNQSNSNNSGTCSDLPLTSRPDLFQIRATSTTATLYFAPISDLGRYFISYSTNPSGEEYGTEVNLSSQGVQSYTVNLLKPSSIYYFKIRGQSGCQPGPWADSIRIVTKPKNTKASSVFYKYSSKVGTLNQAKKAVTKKGVTPPPKAVEKIEPKQNVESSGSINKVETKKSCTKFLWWCF